MLTILLLLLLVAIFGGTAALAFVSKVIAFIFVVALIAAVISAVIGWLTVSKPNDEKTE